MSFFITDNLVERNNRPPLWPFVVNKDSIQAQNIYEFWPFYSKSNKVNGVIRSNNATSQNNLKWETGIQGKPGIKFNNSINDSLIAPVDVSTYTDQKFSVVAILENGDISQNASSAIMSSGSIGSAQAGWSFKYEQFNNTSKVGFTFGGVSDYTFNFLTPALKPIEVLALSVNNNSATIMLNGVFETQSIGNIILSDLDDFLHIGEFKSQNNSSDFLLARIVWLAYYSEPINKEVMFSFYNPNTRWDLLHNLNRTFYSFKSYPPFNVKLSGVSMSGITF